MLIADFKEQEGKRADRSCGLFRRIKGPAPAGTRYGKGVFVFQILKRRRQGQAWRVHLRPWNCPDPCFMNVGPRGPSRGSLLHDLKTLGCQIELSNTYHHLHLQPGDRVVRQLGGLHQFMDWDGPILTDSGGFQVFSLSGLRKITEEEASPSPPISTDVGSSWDRRSPCRSSPIWAATSPWPLTSASRTRPFDYVEASCARTYRWLERCVAEHQRLNRQPGCVNPQQMLFGINQGRTYRLQVRHMEQIAQLPCDGFAIGAGGGEPTQTMYDIIDAVEPHMPREKPRYLMGVGTPSNIIEGVARGIDFFDCVMPARNARHGKLLTWEGTINIKNEKYKLDDRPIDPACTCPTCAAFSRAYVRHLLAAGMLAMRLLSCTTCISITS